MVWRVQNTTENQLTDNSAARDLAAKPLPFLVAWGIPIAIIFVINFVQSYIPFEVTVITIAITVAWIGLSCFVNAFRCGRLHCKVSGPIFFIGAIAMIVGGFGFMSAPGAYLNETVWGTFILALSTYPLEFVWGKYGEGLRQK